MIDVISLAKEAGLSWDEKYHWYVSSEQLKEFARLVTAAEREACAQICDEGSSFDGEIIRKRG